jgi:hypothetical protein
MMLQYFPDRAVIIEYSCTTLLTKDELESTPSYALDGEGRERIKSPLGKNLRK